MDKVGLKQSETGDVRENLLPLGWTDGWTFFPLHTMKFSDETMSKQTSKLFNSKSWELNLTKFSFDEKSDDEEEHEGEEERTCQILLEIPHGLSQVL